MTSRPRPISPHLQVYRPQITSVLSILHRFTGLGLVVGLAALVYWLSAAAYGPEQFERAQAIIGSWPGHLLLFAWTFCLFFHLANGIRHLTWDAGFGFELQTLRLTGWTVVVLAFGFTLLAWIVAYAVRVP